MAHFVANALRFRPSSSVKQSKLLISLSYSWWAGNIGHQGRDLPVRWRLFQRPPLSHVSVGKGTRTLVVGASEATSLRCETENDGKTVKVTWADGGENAAFHAVWLRHNCQCPSCTTSNNMKAIKPSILDPRMTVTSTSLSGDSIKMSWSCGHSGYIKADWLQKNQYPDPSKKTATTAEPTVAMELPKVDGSQLEKEDVLWSWLRDLNEYGVCLLTNLPTEHGTIKKIAKMVYNLQPTVYGETFEVIAEKNPTNLAYSNDTLNFHMDQLFYESPPGLQLLHCVRYDSCIEGGESIMLDMLPVVEELRAEHPKHFEALTQIPATFQRIHYDRAEPVELLQQRPHLMVDKSGKVTAINWSGQVAGPLSVPEEDVIPYYTAYHCLSTMLEESKYKLYHRLQPGEAMTFNNRRVLHSRTGFELNGGVRHLQGAYVNIDEFRSKFQVLCNQLGHQDYPVKRVFNHQSV